MLLYYHLPVTGGGSVPTSPEACRIAFEVCRHTYCSNQARAGMNPKTLQYLMGCCVPVARV